MVLNNGSYFPTHRIIVLEPIEGVSLLSIHIATMCGETSFFFAFFLYNLKSMSLCV